MRWHLLGAFLLCSATALAAPPTDAPATAGPSGSAAPADPYKDPSAAPAPSQQPAPAHAPAPDTTPTEKPPQSPPAPAKPASEQQPNPSTDKPGPAPVDQPAPPASDKPSAALPVVPAIDVASAPPACRSAGKLASPTGKISLALCVANAKLGPLQLVDAEASIQDVDAATAPSLAMLDEVAASNDPHWQVIALHAEGDLLATMAARMLSTVPALPAGELHDSRMQLLQPRVQPWLDRAQQAFAEVDRLAKDHPELQRQSALSDAIIDSRRRMTNGLATR
jgi:hypothetical protein